MTRALAILLLAWEPLNFAARLLQVLPTIAYRGWLPVLELGAHAAVAALCAGAGVALLNEGPGARRLATFAILASIARVVQSLYWSALPSNVVPGDEPFYAGVAGVIAALALMVVRRRPSAP